MYDVPCDTVLLRNTGSKLQNVFKKDFLFIKKNLLFETGDLFGHMNHEGMN